MEIQLPKTLPKFKISTTTITRNKTTWAEVFLLLIVIFLGYWFLVSPKKVEVAAQNSQLDAMKTQEADLAKNLDTLKLLATELQNHTAQTKQLDEALPLTGNAMEMQMLLENLAQGAGVTVTDIGVVSKGDSVVAGNVKLLNNPYGVKRSLQKLQASVSVTGNFDNLEAFMRKLESNGRVLDLASFEISPAADSLLQLRVFIDSYYYGPVS
jgi:Tfp pilus assembly protein PilO